MLPQRTNLLCPSYTFCNASRVANGSRANEHAPFLIPFQFWCLVQFLSQSTGQPVVAYYNNSSAAGCFKAPPHGRIKPINFLFDKFLYLLCAGFIVNWFCVNASPWTDFSAFLITLEKLGTLLFVHIGNWEGCTSSMFNLDNILFQSVRNSIASSVGIFGSIPTWIGSTTGQNGGFLAVTPVKYYNWGQLVVWGGIMGLKLSCIFC